MGTKCGFLLFKILAEEANDKISNTSFDILENVGVRIPNEKV